MWLLYIIYHIHQKLATSIVDVSHYILFFWRKRKRKGTKKKSFVADIKIFAFILISPGEWRETCSDCAAYP
ncbi:hypothetical protein NPIL_519801 [Nephila pilipes]|uniref:Uncharacterized protein n=1 Tax=Nephila pilipes TaxID=299642 RepID=A0A8X6NQ90_NEPPI|nr:hypothetical protein NPIL_519801 [Nephila pilipes]